MKYLICCITVIASLYSINALAEKTKCNQLDNFYQQIFPHSYHDRNPYNLLDDHQYALTLFWEISSWNSYLDCVKKEGLHSDREIKDMEEYIELLQGNYEAALFLDQ